MCNSINLFLTIKIFLKNKFKKAITLKIRTYFFKLIERKFSTQLRLFIYLLHRFNRGNYMKNIINYFYNLNIDSIRMIGDKYYFNYQDKNYIYLEIKDIYVNNQTIIGLNTILLKNGMNFFEIVLNKKGEFITYNSNKKYILMIDNIKQDRNFDYYDIASTNINIGNSKIISSLDRTNWSKLWKKKVDYFEWYIEHNDNKYMLLNEYYKYFIGLAENAILYYEDTVSKVKPNICDREVVSHRRIQDEYTYKSLYNPIELVVDHPSRDLTEYLKMIFWNNNYKKDNITIILDDIVLSEYTARMVISRMMFPSFFFDSFEKYIDNVLDNKDIINIIERMNEYENYVYDIYVKLKTKFKIPSIDWIKKRDYSSTLITPNTSEISFTSMVSIPSLSVTSIILQ